MFRTFLKPTLILVALFTVRTAAFASNTAGGTSNGLTFVTMLKNLASGIEVASLAAVIIALFTVIGTALMHREDLGGLMRNCFFIIIGGSILLAGTAFFTQLGGTATAALIR